MISVLLADDQPLIRSGLRALLGGEDDLAVVGEAGTGREAVALCRALRPDVVVMDIRMPDGDGLWATRAICEDAELTATRVLVLTTFELDEYVFEALLAGASGFLGKGGDATGIAAAVRTIHAGERLLSPAATSSLVEHFLQRPVVTPGPAALQALTEREREVVAMVGEGLSNSEIAERLVISPLTAKTHVARALAKTGARDRAQLVVLAYTSGLLRA
ncbi:Response regulator protein VraR [Pseudoclavibacter triregionum]|nr:Response regulator protein VraR [Pseudoclavibacter triregionum]